MFVYKQRENNGLKQQETPVISVIYMHELHNKHITTETVRSGKENDFILSDR